MKTKRNKVILIKIINSDNSRKKYKLQYIDFNRIKPSTSKWSIMFNSIFALQANPSNTVEHVYNTWAYNMFNTIDCADSHLFTRAKMCNCGWVMVDVQCLISVHAALHYCLHITSPFSVKWKYLMNSMTNLNDFFFYMSNVGTFTLLI